MSSKKKKENTKTACYKYHVYYNYVTKDSSGSASIIITRDCRIKTEEDVNTIKKYLIDFYGFENVVVANWIELE